MLDFQPEHGYSYRFGGDEFVVFFPYATKENAEAYKETVLAEVKLSGISVSVGIVVTDPATETGLDEYLAKADSLMYEMKKAEKAKH